MNYLIAMCNKLFSVCNEFIGYVYLACAMNLFGMCNELFGMCKEGMCNEPFGKYLISNWYVQCIIYYLIYVLFLRILYLQFK